MTPHFEVRTEPGGYLRFKDVARVVEHLMAGDLCLLPSDSAYILTGLATIRGVSSDVDRLLMRGGLEISLSFGSLKIARKWVDLSPKALNFLGVFMPGGLTFVGPPTTRAHVELSRARLNAPGTIGIRLTESRVETQMAYEIELPLTTTPVRDLDGSVALAAEQALEIVERRLAEFPSQRRVGVVLGSVVRPGGLSTVVKEINRAGLESLLVIREGAVPLHEVRRVASLCLYEDVIVGQ